jgi:hypothetical protein
MAGNYPHKQTFFIFVICLFLVLGVSFFVNGLPSTKNKVVYQNTSIKPQIISNEKPIETGTEWQKAFLDQKDNVKIDSPNTIDKTKVKEESLNPTELLGRNFFTKYVQLRQSGLTTDTEAVNAVANQVINDGVSSIKGPSSYTAKNIKISSGSSVDDIKKYAENLMLILKDSMPVKNEAEIAMIAFDSGDMNLLKEIDKVIAGYKKADSKLLSTPVPQILAQYHLDLINGLSVQTFNAQSLRNSDKDPLTGLAAIGMEVKSLQAIANAIAGMQNIFTQQGITFVLPASGSILQSP